MTEPEQFISQYWLIADTGLRKDTAVYRYSTLEHPVSPLVSSHMTGPATLTTTALNHFLSAKLAARQTVNYANTSQSHNKRRDY